MQYRTYAIDIRVNREILSSNNNENGLLNNDNGNDDKNSERNDDNDGNKKTKIIKTAPAWRFATKTITVMVSFKKKGKPENSAVVAVGEKTISGDEPTNLKII